MRNLNRGNGSVGAQEGNLTEQQVDLRSELARHLRPHLFPTDAGPLRDVASSEGASDRVLRFLDKLPSRRVFENLEEVWETLGGPEEERF